MKLRQLIRTYPTLALLVFGLNTAQAAEEPLAWYEQLGKDLAAPVLSPGRTYGLIGSGLTLATLPLKNTHFQASIAERKPLGSWSCVGYELGFWKINAAYIVSFLGYGLISGEPAAVSKSLLMLRASVYTALLTTGIKELALEERPRNNGDMNSFPSGHASNVFAFAGTIYRNHGWAGGIPAFAMAGFVSFSRLNDNAHYLHDVIFGGTIGLSYAMGLDTEWSSDDGSRSVAVIPLVRSDSLGLGTFIEF